MTLKASATVDPAAVPPRPWEILTSPALRWIALFALCAAYLQGGLDKVMDFSAAEAELTRFGVTPAEPFAALTIAVELGGSFLVLSGLYRWLGALGLAGFSSPARWPISFGLPPGRSASLWKMLSSNISASPAASCLLPGTTGPQRAHPPRRVGEFSCRRRSPPRSSHRRI
jgi:hypothetical protein